jgi:hypothetical protein
VIYISPGPGVIEIRNGTSRDREAIYHFNLIKREAIKYHVSIVIYVQFTALNWRLVAELLFRSSMLIFLFL